MSTIKTTTLSTLDGTYTVPAETLARGACRAWVNFNGTGTVAIRASFNVSSVTDNGTGQYTVNFTTAMPDADYALAGTCRLDNLSGVSNMFMNQKRSGVQSTTACDVSTQNQASSFVDCDRVFAVFIR